MDTENFDRNLSIRQTKTEMMELEIDSLLEENNELKHTIRDLGEIVSQLEEQLEEERREVRNLLMYIRTLGDK